MDGGGGRRVALCGGAGQDKTILNITVPRFRPIAPKPVTGIPASENRNTMSLAGKRPKRKYVRVRRNTRQSRKSGEELQKQDGSEKAVAILESVPENTEVGKGSVAGDSRCKNVDLNPTAEKIKIQYNQENGDASKMLDRTVRVVDSWVTVESVTDTCMEAGGLGRTDAEKVKNLERDTCPGFVSDGLNRVRWVNEAYKKMVSNQEVASPEIVVWLKIKDKEVYSHQAFTCKVRLHYESENGKCTKMVPSDVWRMERSGFAWRLDVQTALSLGL